MSYEQKEIKTIRERNITVKLSNADCEKLIKKCGKFGLTPGELIENFISDLIDGTYSNGSDERYLINQKEYLKDHPEEADEESIFIDEDIAYFEDELKNMRTSWKPKKLKMDEEIELIEKWVNDKDTFIY